MNNNPIGVFDSGLGGISVLNYLTTLLPDEQFVYVADSAWCPYGTKPFDQIQSRSKAIVDFFLTMNVKMVVVACNTATAAAIKMLRSEYEIPFVGMEPAIKPAAMLTKTNTVGVLATQNTFNGAHFKETSNKYAKNIKTVIQVGHGLVEIVENNEVESPKAYELIEKYTKPMCEANSDYIVLGCTHYPFLTKVIEKVAPMLKVIDPALPVAKRTHQLLNEFNLMSDNTSATPVQLYTTGELNKLKAFADSYVSSDWNALEVNI